MMPGEFFHIRDGIWAATTPPEIENCYKAEGETAMLEKYGSRLDHYDFSISPDLNRVFELPDPIRLFIPGRGGDWAAAEDLRSYLGCWSPGCCAERTCDEWIADHIVNPMLARYRARWTPYYRNGHYSRMAREMGDSLGGRLRDFEIASTPRGWLTTDFQGLTLLIAGGKGQFVESLFSQIGDESSPPWVERLRKAAGKGDAFEFAEAIIEDLIKRIEQK